MNGGWLRFVGRGLLGYAVGVGLDVLALSFTGAGHGDYPMGHVSLALLPVVWLIGIGPIFTLLVVGPAWAACYGLLPALAPGPRWSVLMLVLAGHIHALLAPRFAFGRMPGTGVLYGACLLAGLGFLLWLCWDRAPQEH